MQKSEVRGEIQTETSFAVFLARALLLPDVLIAFTFVAELKMQLLVG